VTRLLILSSSVQSGFALENLTTFLPLPVRWNTNLSPHQSFAGSGGRNGKYSALAIRSELAGFLLVRARSSSMAEARIHVANRNSSRDLAPRRYLYCRFSSAGIRAWSARIIGEVMM
jgi:hypothetical protein